MFRCIQFLAPTPYHQHDISQSADPVIRFSKDLKACKATKKSMDKPLDKLFPGLFNGS